MLGFGAPRSLSLPSVTFWEDLLLEAVESIGDTRELDGQPCKTLVARAERPDSVVSAAVSHRDSTNWAAEVGGALALWPGEGVPNTEPEPRRCAEAERMPLAELTDLGCETTCTEEADVEAGELLSIVAAGLLEAAARAMLAAGPVRSSVPE